MLLFKRNIFFFNSVHQRLRARSFGLLPLLAAMDWNAPENRPTVTAVAILISAVSAYLLYIGWCLYRSYQSGEWTFETAADDLKKFCVHKYTQTKDFISWVAFDDDFVIRRKLRHNVRLLRVRWWNFKERATERVVEWRESVQQKLSPTKVAPSPVGQADPSVDSPDKAAPDAQAADSPELPATALVTVIDDVSCPPSPVPGANKTGVRPYASAAALPSPVLSISGQGQQSGSSARYERHVETAATVTSHSAVADANTHGQRLQGIRVVQ